jgi:RNA polymerase-binding transcription factor DksA
MKKKDLKRFAELLKENLSKKQEYIEILRGMGIGDDQDSGSAGSSVYVTHPADVSGDSAEKERLAGLLTRETDAVVAITEALEKIDEGIYGVCEGCGEDIPKARLEVVPEARYCVKCKDKYGD